MKFYSQQKEDEFIINNFLKKNENYNCGVYLECGASDGILYSNTKTLEDFFGFNGILIEPQKYFFDKLIINRPNNENYNCCISNNNKPYVNFTFDNSVPVHERGILETFSTRGARKNYNYNKKIRKIENKKLKDILNKSKFKYIDFMIIDVEGGEISFLNSIDFNFPIFCIIIEQHKNDDINIILKIHKILALNNFTLVNNFGNNEFWINFEYFRANKFNLNNLICKCGIPVGSRPADHKYIYIGTNEEPWLSRGSINYIYNFYFNQNNNINVLEYGSGSSTLWFLKNKCKVTSIEHVEYWLNKLKENIPIDLKKNWTPILKKTNTENINNDYDGSDNENYEDYAKEVNNLEMFDIIVIDGRCRRNCLKNSIPHLKSNGLFILDNADHIPQKKIDLNLIPDDWIRLDFGNKIDLTIVWYKI
jgi:hypothetical protein